MEARFLAPLPERPRSDHPSRFALIERKPRPKLLVQYLRRAEELIGGGEQDPSKPLRIVSWEFVDELADLGGCLRRLVARERGIRPALREEDVAGALDLRHQVERVENEFFR